MRTFDKLQLTIDRGKMKVKRFVTCHMSHVKGQRGFTLLELLIVIAIIGVLAGIVIMALNPLTQIQKAHDAQRKSDVKEIQKALEAYYNDNGSYPTTGSSGVNSNTGGTWIPGLTTNYIAKVPVDPTNTYTNLPWLPGGATTYSYIYVSYDRCGGTLKAGQYYLLYSHMEIAGDTSAGNQAYLSASCTDGPYAGWRIVTNP